MEPINQQSGKQKRGFAVMNPEKQKEIAKMGGRAAHEKGVAHQWTSQEARDAGKKGGQARTRSYNNGNDMPTP